MYVLRYIGTIDRGWARRDNQTHNISMHILSEYELHSIIQQTTLTLPMGSAGKVARLAHSSMPNCSKQSSISSDQRSWRCGWKPSGEEVSVSLSYALGLRTDQTGIPHESKILIGVWFAFYGSELSFCLRSSHFDGSVTANIGWYIVSI